MKRKKTAMQKDNTKILFLFPSVLFIFLFIVYPIVYSAVLALSKITFSAGVLTTEFSGFANFTKILGQSLFWEALKNTLFFTILRVASTFLIGIIVALVVSHAKGFIAKLLKTFFLVPWALSNVVNGLMWQWMYNSQYGIANEILLQFGLIDAYVPWLNQPSTALLAIIFADTWKSVPFVSLMFLAALQNVSQDMYDAAEVDGANVFQRFFYVTIPAIRPIIMITLIIQTMWAFKAFDLIWVLTQGGPLNSTTTLAVMSYRESFHYLRLGTGAAMSYMLTFLSVLFILLYLKMNGSEDIGE
ncbi:MAG: carbohydrate ABC transporter permease [Sphaerochaetaceae bacterium]